MLDRSSILVNIRFNHTLLILIILYLQNILINRTQAIKYRNHNNYNKYNPEIIIHTCQHKDIIYHSY
jgi:hypothetical protein